MTQKPFFLSGLTEDKKATVIFFGIISIAFLGIILYSNILHAPFVYDDYGAIVDNDIVKNLKFSLKDISNNRYLTNLSFAINYSLGGLKPFGYHLVNNIIHVINAILVYYLVILTFRTPYFSYQPSAIISHQQSSYSPLPAPRASRQTGVYPFTYSPFFIAFSSAFIFISHPIQTQAVTYITQRATSMATMFYLLSLVMYIKFRMQDTGCKIQDARYRMQDTRYRIKKARHRI